MESVTEIVERMVNDFVELRWDELSKIYSFPIVVFFGADIFVLTDKADFLSKIQAYHAALASQGVSHIQSSVEEVKSIGQERCQFLVRNEYCQKDDTGLSEARIRYFLEQQQGVLKVRMVEYLNKPFEQVDQDGSLFEDVH
ncbi:MAG: hypothetical protein AAGK71_13610 [Pseudomonadota bacterium]